MTGIASTGIVPSGLAPSAGGGGGYTLSLTGGAIQFSGASMGLLAGRKLSLTPNAITFAGATIGLGRGYGITLTPAQITATGGAMSLEAGRVLALAGGAVSFSGATITLTYTPAGTIVIEPAAITFVGATMDLLYTPARQQTGTMSDGPDRRKKKRHRATETIEVVKRKPAQERVPLPRLWRQDAPDLRLPPNAEPPVLDVVADAQALPLLPAELAQEAQIDGGAQAMMQAAAEAAAKVLAEEAIRKARNARAAQAVAMMLLM